MDNFEKYISTQIQADSLNFKADEAIHQRLMYHMQIKSAKARVRKNAMIPSFAHLFTSKFLALKFGAIAALLLFFVGYQQMNQQLPLLQLSDSVQVIQNLDTTYIFVEDSINFN